MPSNSQIARVLLIDDQWGSLDDPMIPGRYGSLPFEWLRETAADDSGRHSVDAALNRVRLEAHNLSVLMLDINFGESGERLGVDILQAVRAEYPTLPILMFTSFDSDENRELVIRCMELGANEYVEKGHSAARMHEILSIYTDPYSDHALYGNSSPIRLLRAKVARIAFSGETSILVVGESGTGKELVARALHRQGPRKQGPFVAKNCAHSDLQLLDSELFGHERGSFTGAIAQRRGLIEEADGGVLFLDEVADMPLELQAKLLRTLETRTFRRVGAVNDFESKFQLICATNRSPEELMRDGRLREDFYYRVATMTIHVPPLRDRQDDIPILAEWFLKRFKDRGGASYLGRSFSADFLSSLVRHDWPGNVRELRNVVERALIMSRKEVIGEEELPESVGKKERVLSNEAVYEDCNGSLPKNVVDWPKARLISELRLAIEVRKRVQAYKGNQWKAEFMRLMYPECKAASAKGFDDLIKRLTQGPWGYSRWKDDQDLTQLVDELRN